MAIRTNALDLAVTDYPFPGRYVEGDRIVRRREKFVWLTGEHYDAELDFLLVDKWQATGDPCFCYETIVKPIGKPSK